MTAPKRHQGSERRSYYRIQEDVLLQYAIADSAGSAAIPAEGVALSSGDLLQAIDQELHNAINLIFTESAAVAKALGLLNRKISVLASTLYPTQSDNGSNYIQTRVSLSGSGIAFETDEFLQKSTRLQLSLRLLPSHHHVCLFANVVADAQALDAPGSRFAVRAAFEEDAEAQERLIQHVVQRQGMLLKEEG